MEISEVRVKLISNPTDRLKAFASVTLDDDFVVRDIKIIEGTSGVFVAMPSRKLADRCPNCGTKNHMRARYCNECGKGLGKDRGPRDRRGRTKLHADIAHPINSECRQRLQQRIVEAYQQELERAEEPGYRPLSDEEYEDAELDLAEDFGGSAAEDTAADEVPQEDAVAEEGTPGDSGGYDSLIADLKRDAAARRGSSERSAPGGSEPEPERAPRRRTRKEPQQVAVPVADAPQKRTVESEPPDHTDGDSGPPDDFGAGIV